MAAKTFVSKLLMLIAFVLLFNAGVSMMNYRRYLTFNVVDHTTMVAPLDIKLEMAAGTFLGLLGSVLMFID